MANPLVILGLDVANGDLLLQWAREGRLPALAAVLERGCWGATAGPDLISEHAVWVSLLSGVSRGAHGYYYFRQLQPGTYNLRPCTGRDAAAAPPFWAALAGSRARAAILDVPDLFPVAGLAGIQLSNWDPHSHWITWLPETRPIAEPLRLLQEAAGLYGPRRPAMEVYDGNPEADRRRFREALDRTQRRGRLYRGLLQRHAPFDLVAAFFTECHTAAHQLWDYRPGSRHPGAGRAPELAEAIPEVYAGIDHQCAELLRVLPPTANVVIASATGLLDHYPTLGLLQSFCRELGYWHAPAPGKPSLHPFALLRQAMPQSWREALSRPLPPRVREGLYVDAFRRGTDWSRTTAFAIPGQFTGYLRVNLEGREPQGIVRPGTEYRQTLDQLERDLALLTDPATGEPSVASAARSDDLFGPDRHPALPDLFVHWRPHARFIERVAHPRVVLTQARPEFFRSNDHTTAGFFAAAGPDVPGRGDLGEVPLLDLAPTLLSLMGRAPTPEMAGKPLEALCRAPALAARS